MKLMTKEVLKRLAPLYSNDGIPPSEVKVPLKLFDPCGAGTWYITEFDGEDTMFGYVNGLGEGELGYISLSEISAVRNRFGLGIERDLHWDPNTTLEAVMK